MRHIQFKPAVLAVLIALLLSLTSAIYSKRYAGARFTQTGLQGCFAGILPSDCDPAVTGGTPCTSSFGTATRTWYKDSNCTEPIYKKP